MKGISEAAFATQVEDLLTRYDWRWVHPRPAWDPQKDGYRTAFRGWDPDGNQGKGMPDYIAVHREQHRLLFIELKKEGGKLGPGQEGWLGDLRFLRRHIFEPMQGPIVMPEVYLWRPSQIEEILEIIRGY